MIFYLDSSYVICYDILQQSEIFNGSVEVKRKIDIKVIKYTKKGIPAWEMILDTKFADYVVGVVLVDENKLMVLSESWDDSYKNERKIILTQINHLGQLLYQKEISKGTPSAILKLEDNGIFIAYSSRAKEPLSSEYNEELFVSKVDLDGKIIWTKPFGFFSIQAGVLSGGRSFYLKKYSNNKIYFLIKNSDGTPFDYTLSILDVNGKAIQNRIKIYGYVDDYYLDQNNNFYTLEQGWRTLINKKRVRTLNYNHYKNWKNILSVNLGDSMSFISKSVLKLTNDKKLTCCFTADKKLFVKLLSSSKVENLFYSADQIHSNCTMFNFNKQITVLSVGTDDTRKMGHGHELIMYSFSD